MNRVVRTIVAGLCLALHLSWFGGSLDGAEPGPIKILVVGNSFTNNATHFLPDFVKASGGRELLIRRATVGGGPLDQHWKAVVAHEANPEDPKGRIYADHSLKDRLQMEPWDFVTIQQNSFKSRDIATYRPYAADLCAYIRQHSPTAEIVIHQTWAYRADDPLFMEIGYSQRVMYRELTNAYVDIAKELSVKKIIPVGRAFQDARADPRWRFVYPDPSFDYAQPVFPALPQQGQSLNVGWHWDGDENLRFDGHHASVYGKYLATAVWFEFFMQQDVRNNGFVPSEITQDEAAILRDMAHGTLAKDNLVK